MDAIWEDFRQLDQSTTRSYGGTGLGLSITRRLTHQLGGYVSVESEFGVGTTFSVRLPVDVSTAAARSAICDLTIGTGGNFPPCSSPSPSRFRCSATSRTRWTTRTPSARAPGMRAVVPFRNRREIGVIVGAAEPAAGVTPKRVASLPDAAPVLGERMLALCRWMSEYYVVPLGVVIRSALPAALSSHDAPAPSQRTRRVASLAAIFRRSSSATDVFKRAPQQRALFELIESLGGRAAGRASDGATEVLGVGAQGSRGRAAWSRSTTKSSRAIHSRGVRCSRRPTSRRRSRSGARSRARGRRRRRRLLAARRDRAAAKRSSTSSCCGASCSRKGRRRSCSCRRSRSRRRPSIDFAPCSATRSPCCTAR